MGNTDVAFRAVVDRALCQGHGLCQITAPDIFELDGDGLSVVRVDEVPVELEAAARDAESSCPQEAISLEGRRRPSG